jgi:hypothetical protein
MTFPCDGEQNSSEASVMICFAFTPYKKAVLKVIQSVTPAPFEHNTATPSVAPEAELNSENPNASSFPFCVVFSGN